MPVGLIDTVQSAELQGPDMVAGGSAPPPKVQREPETEDVKEPVTPVGTMTPTMVPL